MALVGQHALSRGHEDRELVHASGGDLVDAVGIVGHVQVADRAACEPSELQVEQPAGRDPAGRLSEVDHDAVRGVIAGVQPAHCTP